MSQSGQSEILAPVLKDAEPAVANRIIRLFRCLNFHLLAGLVINMRSFQVVRRLDCYIEIIAVENSDGGCAA